MPDAHDPDAPGESRPLRLADVAVERFHDEVVVLVIARERFVTLDRSGGEVLDEAVEALAGKTLRPADIAAFLGARYDLTGDEAAAAAERLARDWLGGRHPGACVSEVTMSSRVTPAAHVQLRSEGDDGALLYDPKADRVAVLNLTAAAVWGLLDGDRTVAEVVTELAAEYEGMGPDAAAQVLRTIQWFVDRGAAHP